MSASATAGSEMSPTAARAGQRLVSAGFAERRASEEDGRVVHVVITEADVARAIGKWDTRVDPEYRGLLEAHAVRPEVEE
mgnify:CR=1 FL=1